MLDSRRRPTLLRLECAEHKAVVPLLAPKRAPPEVAGREARAFGTLWIRGKRRAGGTLETGREDGAKTRERCREGSHATGQ